jgi:hypothetical protein
MGLSELSTLLWRERQALEHLLFKLTVEQLVVNSGQSRWLDAANVEVEAAANQVRAIEVIRSAVADEVSAELGLALHSSLAELADAAPEPWKLMLGEHRTALIVMIGQVEQVCDNTRQLLAATARSVRQTLLALNKGADTYDARGVLAAASGGALLMDELA